MKFPQVRKAKTAADTVRMIWEIASLPENIEYAKRFKFRDLRDLYWQLKRLTRFKHDPNGGETVQQIRTLFGSKNVHGIIGAGDCDCFTSAILSIAFANRIPARVVILGNRPKKPTHVYPELFWNNKWRAVDLTADSYDVIRPYKYRQTFNNMDVTLADDELSARPFRRLGRLAKKAARITPAYQIGRAALNYTPQGRFISRAGRQFRFRLSDDGDPVELIMSDGYSVPLSRRGRGVGRAIRQAGRWVGRNASGIAAVGLPLIGGAANLIAPGSGALVSRLTGRIQSVAGRAQLNRLTPIAMRALQQSRAGRVNIVAPELPVNPDNITSINPAQGSTMPMMAVAPEGGASTPAQTANPSQWIKGVPNVAVIAGAGVAAYLLTR
ncbi:hypothetical protein EBR96_03680, partial [bacterium]|nr:hypothetical protein [bacterium]